MKIEIDGQAFELDVEKAKQLGVLSEPDLRCKSWEDFKSKYGDTPGFSYSVDVLRTHRNPLLIPEQLTESDAIAIAAFSKLLKLRRDWVGDFSPSRMVREQPNKVFTFYAIAYNSKDDTFGISEYHSKSRAFMFPTYEECSDFKECFIDLFKACKYLI